MRKASILAALLLLAPAVSQAKTLEDLLVEKGVISKGEAKEAAGAPAKVYYNGGTRFDFADAGVTAQVNTMIITRYTYRDGDEDFADTNSSSFDVNQARIKVSGSALHEEFNYAVNGDFVGTSTDGTKSASLKDAWIQWNGCDWFQARMGQFKTGTSRQYNTDDYQLQFADRTIVSDNFDLGRQAGLRGSASAMDGALDLSAGIYNGESNGEGTNRSGVDTDHTGIVTARWNAMGKMNAMSEGDVDWTDDAAVNVGASYAASSYTADQDYDTNTITVDANLKTQGFSLHGEYFVADVEPDVGDSVTPQGFYVQAGYFLKPKTLEIAARYGLLDCDDGQAVRGECAAGVDQVNQASASINYYWWKHNVKAQFGYDNVSKDFSEGDTNQSTNRWMLQLVSYL